MDINTMTAKEKKNLRVFGYGLGIIITFIVVRHGMKHGGIGVLSYVWLTAAVILAYVTAVNLPAIKPFYLRWMKVAHFIGTIVSGIVLSVLFYVVFGLVGIVMRIFRQNPLDEKWDKSQASYWIKRGDKAFDQKSYQYQF